MNNYKAFLTAALLGVALILSYPAKAALTDSLAPVPVEAGWNPSIWIFKMLHSSPNGRYFSYIEYAGDNVGLTTPEYSEDRQITYRYVVFDRSTGTSLYSPGITVMRSLAHLATEQTFLFPSDDGGLYFTRFNNDENDGVYYINSAGQISHVFDDKKMLVSLSLDGRYFLLSNDSIYDSADDISGYSLLDSQNGVSYSLSFLEGYSLSSSSSYYVTNNGQIVVESGDPRIFQIVNPVNGTFIDAASLVRHHVNEAFSFGNGILLTPDGQRFVARITVGGETKVVYVGVDDNSFISYSLSDLGLTEYSGGYSLDVRNLGFGFSASAGVNQNGVLHYSANIAEQEKTFYGVFSLENGQLQDLSSLVSESGQWAFSSVVAGGPGGQYYFLGGEFSGDALPIGWNYFYLPVEGAERSLKIDVPSAVVDTYYSPQFSVDIKTLGEHYAVDADCTLNGPAAITTATYGNWGSANRLQLPLQWTGQDIKGALSQTAPEAAVDGEQSLFATVMLADMTTDTLTISCHGEMSDVNGNLLPVAADTVTITLDDGIHGGSSAVSGQIALPGSVSAEDVTVSITIDGRTISVSPDSTGNFSFSGLRAGDFVVDFQSEGYVQSCMNASLDGTAAADIGTVELLAGDINHDGQIDIADFTFLSGRYGLQQGDAEYAVEADLNKDAAINVQDLAILASHFGSQQCNP